MNNEIIIDFKSPCGGYILTFEDNGKVAYAYLKKNNEIIGDVWLYNKQKAPIIPEYNDKKNIPFANSKEYINEDGMIDKPIILGDIQVDWEDGEVGPLAYVYVFEKLYGVVGVNTKPGIARYALKNNRLANVMEVE